MPGYCKASHAFEHKTSQLMMQSGPMGKIFMYVFSLTNYGIV